MIVGLGSGLFTLVSVYGFTASNHVDPTRIAAQIVSGIGFLGAGVILRYGVNVRGVTTAAALWISAAIGMAAAAGFYLGAAATTVFALVVLVALRRLKPVVRRRLGSEALSLELELVPGASIRSLLGELRRRQLRVEGLKSTVLDDGAERVELDVRGPASLDVDSILSGLSQMDDVARIELAVLSSLEIDDDEEDSPEPTSPGAGSRCQRIDEIGHRVDDPRGAIREPCGLGPGRDAAEHEDCLEPRLEPRDDVRVHPIADHRGALRVGAERR